MNYIIEAASIVVLTTAAIVATVIVPLPRPKPEEPPKTPPVEKVETVAPVTEGSAATVLKAEERIQRVEAEVQEVKQDVLEIKKALKERMKEDERVRR